MPYFALFYDIVDDFAARRVPFRAAHLQKATEAQTRGELLLGGALPDPFDRALLIFCAADISVVETFAKSDPYVVHGLVMKWEARLWNVVVGLAYKAEVSKEEAIRK